MRRYTEERTDFKCNVALPMWRLSCRMLVLSPSPPHWLTNDISVSTSDLFVILNLTVQLSKEM